MSLEFTVKGILLDVEGTTSAVSYVYDVMFPYVRTALAGYLDAQWDADEMMPVKQQVAVDAGAESFDAWTVGDEQRSVFETEIVRLMDGDVKATGLKQLQGLIWRDGFESGALRSHVFPDVAPALEHWTTNGLDVRIYSSGSVLAQKLFFAHTEEGDLTRYLSGHYDTTTGPKREAASYTAIAADWGIDPAEILFLSDITAELDAAREAGLATALTVRPGNAEAESSTPPHPSCDYFSELRIGSL